MSLGVASPVQAQDIGQIEGTVTTTEGEPLPGATVQIIDLERGTSTNANGRFDLRGVPAGRHVLTVRFIGYQSVEQDLTSPPAKAGRFFTGFSAHIPRVCIPASRKRSY